MSLSKMGFEIETRLRHLGIKTKTINIKNK